MNTMNYMNDVPQRKELEAQTKVILKVWDY